MTIFGRMRKAARRIEARSKRRAEELAIESISSLEEEEDQEDPASTSKSLEEGEGAEIPSQLDLVDKLESPPTFQINKLATCLTPRRPMTRPKHQASKKKTARPSSGSRKRPRR